MFNDFLYMLFAFPFALGVIIFVHEAGHLLVAKAFNVRVHTFSLGFGKRLWGFRRGETDYRVSLIPLGGYVKLGGEMPDEATGDPREFLAKPRWQRILVYLAGPAMNVVLAIALIAGVFMVGTTTSDLPDIEAVIGGVIEGSSAEEAGLQRGDRVLAVDGEPVERWAQVSLALLTSPDRAVELTLERQGRTLQAAVTPNRLDKYEIGDLAGLYPSVRPSITRVEKDSPAARGGLEVGDQLTSVDGRPVNDGKSFADHIAAHAETEVVLGVLRKQRPVELRVTPKTDDQGRGLIGVGLGFYQRYGLVDAVVQSCRYNLQIVQQTFVVLDRIFKRRLSAKGALAGPIEIAVQSGQAAQTGFKNLLHLMGLLSISIALVNLLPIPILDGGQITILLVESVLRRDLSLRFKEIVAQVGFVLIMLLTVTVIYFDLAKNLPFGGS
ncbi:MAG: site-2 protease family protein [Acidobacteriota bacterium]